MNPKTSKPDRKKKGDRRKKEPSDFEETTLSIDRVTRVVAGGRRMRFRAVVVIGDKKGRVGLGTGKANEVQAAVQKATAVAKRNMIKVPVDDGSIPHEIDHKFKAARIRLIAGGHKSRFLRACPDGGLLLRHGDGHRPGKSHRRHGYRRLRRFADGDLRA